MPEACILAKGWDGDFCAAVLNTHGGDETSPYSTIVECFERRTRPRPAVAAVLRGAWPVSAFSVEPVVVEDVRVSPGERPNEREKEFRFVEVGDRTYMVRCRRERPFSVLYHFGFGHLRRTARGELRWLVDVETDQDPFPVVRESHVDEDTARDRAAEIEAGLRDGTFSLKRRPAPLRWAPWTRRTTQR